MERTSASFDALVALWGRPRHLAADLGVSPRHLGMMRSRRSIPVRFWPRLVAGAARRGIAGLNYEALVRLHVPESADGSGPVRRP